MESNNISLYWFRNDLRINDNPALYESLLCNDVVPIFIYDNSEIEDCKLGATSKWWLHNSLKSLNNSLDNKIHFFYGQPEKILLDFINHNNINKVYWNRSNEPWSIERDTKIKKILENKNILVKTYNANLLWEPYKIKKSDGNPYKVFTPFFKKGCLQSINPRIPLNKAKIENLKQIKNETKLTDLNLTDEKLWHKKLNKYWNPGEENAINRMNDFFSKGIYDYKIGRNFPGKKNVSKLSPHIHFGEISPNTIWHETDKLKEVSDKNTYHFKSELGWREFSYYLLFHFPKITNSNFQEKFNNFPWIKNQKLFDLWKRGKTGYPIVDAGMRELWETGYIHNRVRMIVSSFLVKNLLIDWRMGERWFWDCLVDADLANNKSSWQWVAGSGADAAPYFRIFNPVTQGQKFDNEGNYTKRFIPELKDLDIEFLFKPWEAPSDVLRKAGVNIGKNYPKPIVDLKQSREKALELFANL
ncbi:MAG: deoxyribodipyrimidine photo-lyase [Dehalococcoidales bacterium]|nr:deoxyribodipyrimidine photo-lyase [Dehalococcoidales bacterium]